jgi:hypothetical protein
MLSLTVLVFFKDVNNTMLFFFQFLRSSTNLFLLNLSVADLLVLAVCTPTSLLEIATRKDAWILGKASQSFRRLGL